jgi:flavin reductase
MAAQANRAPDIRASNDSLRASFIDGMSRVATSVTIVSTDGPGNRFALTVSAMASVSADPPTLLVCINRRNPIEAAIRANGVFAVSALRADQRRVAETFAGRPRQGLPYDFNIGRWETAVTGAPVLAGSVAWFDCRLIAIHQVGTHTIAIGRVAASGASPGTPLVYGRRSFGELMQLPDLGPAGDLFPYPVWDEPENEEGFE